jgi:4-alpha-glucanotransferase
VLDLNPDKKLAGVLAPVFALRGRGDLGVGDTEAVKELISWSARQGMRVVQVLPINETGSDSSPYNLLSAMALEPSTLAVTPDALPDLKPEDFAAITARHDLAALTSGPVKYGAVKPLKRELLYAAFKNFRSRSGDKSRMKVFAKFEEENAGWLPDYALHRALVSWHEESEVSGSWPREHRSPVAARLWLEGLTPASKRQVRDFMRFHAYVQWVAYTQWRGVREHAERENVALMGDVPVGVSIYSTDVWREPDIFDLARSSGAPPEKVFKADPFTEKWGQNWGFPLYHWEKMARDDYAWWRRRLRLLMSLFHLLRVDHALGFFRIYSFPWRPEDNAKFIDLTPDEARAITGGELPQFMDRDDETEENRAYNRAHGERLFKMLVEGIGPHRLIAEDLGEVAPYVRPTLQALEIPGFKIPQWEREWDRLIPGNEYQRLSLATYATHDHAPVKTYWNDLDAAARTENAQVRDAAIHSMWELVNFCGKPDFKLPQPFSPELHELLLRGLFSCNSWLAVNMITDIFGTEERFNVPGSAGDTNWTQRMAPIAEWDTAQAAPLAILRQVIAETGRV